MRGPSPGKRGLPAAVMALGVALAVAVPAPAKISIGTTGAGRAKLKDLEADAGRRRQKRSLPASSPSPALPVPGFAGWIEIPRGDLRAIVADPTRKLVYVSDAVHNCVQVVSTETYAVEASVAVGTEPGTMDIDPAGGRLWVALGSGYQVVAVDLATRTVAGRMDLPYPPALALAVGAGERLFVGMAKPDGTPLIRMYGIGLLPATDLGQLGAADAYLVGWSRDRSFVYAADDSAASVVQWSVAGAPAAANSGDLFGGVVGSGVGVSSRIVHDAGDTRLCVVGDGDANDGGKVPVRRRADLGGVGEISAPARVTAIGFSPAGGEIYTAGQDRTDLIVFAAASLAEMRRYPLGAEIVPHGIAVEVGGKVFCLLEGNPPDRVGVVLP